jgi:hypothetical protein
MDQVRVENNRVIFACQREQALTDLGRRGDTPLGKLTAVITQEFCQSTVDTIVGAVVSIALKRVG